MHDKETFHLFLLDSFYITLLFCHVHGFNNNYSCDLNLHSFDIAFKISLRHCFGLFVVYTLL